MFMEVLDTAIASVALPYIAGSLSASNSEATWVLTSYLVANAVILPASNWFARRFGRKNFPPFCVTMFTVAVLLRRGALVGEHRAGVGLGQGAGGGALQPLSQPLLLEAPRSRQRSTAMAAYGLGTRGSGAGADTGRLVDRYVQPALRGSTSTFPSASWRCA